MKTKEKCARPPNCDREATRFFETDLRWEGIRMAVAYCFNCAHTIERTGPTWREISEEEYVVAKLLQS